MLTVVGGSRARRILEAGVKMRLDELGGPKPLTDDKLGISAPRTASPPGAEEMVGGGMCPAPFPR